MASPPASAVPPRGEPPWDVALFFPRQGDWTDADYLALDSNRPIELVDGCRGFSTRVGDLPGLGEASAPPEP